MKAIKLLSLLPFLLAACHEYNSYTVEGEAAEELNQDLDEKLDQGLKESEKAVSVMTEATPTLASDGSVSHVKLNANGEEIKMYVLDSPSPQLYVDGSSPSIYEAGKLGQLDADQAQLGAIYGAYVTQDSHVSYASTIDRLDASGFSPAEREGILQNLEWEEHGIDFGYVYANGNQTPIKTTGSDGKISFGANGVWNAEFGEVSLKGNLEGTKVSGEATLHEMRGSFSGVDGVIIDDNVHQVTGGSFNGTDGGKESFAGGWFGRK